MPSPSSHKWIWFIVCTILFGASPWIFVAINTNIVKGDANLNYYFFYILFTVPAAVIILVIGFLIKLSLVSREKEG